MLEKFVFGHGSHAANFRHHGAHMTDRLHHIARTRLSLRPDHRGALRYASKRLAQIAGPADERHGETRLVNMMHIVRRRENLGLVHVVDIDRLENLRLDEMADAALCHDRYGDGVLDTFDHLRVAHAGNAPGRPNVSGNSLESHDRARSRLLRNARLFGRRDVHDHAAFQHTGQRSIQRSPLLRDSLIFQVEFVFHRAFLSFEQTPWRILLPRHDGINAGSAG